MNGRIHLADSLALVQAALRPYAVVVQPDPLRLQLPPAGYGGGVTLPDAGALRVLGALYLYAELEQAGIIPVAEVLAENRDTLTVNSDEVAGKLNAFAHKGPVWYDRPHRSMLFARLFGTGAGASNDAGTLVNRDFERCLGAFCLAVISSTASASLPGYSLYRTNSQLQDAHLMQSAMDLLTNLGARQFGNTLLAARAVHEQFTLAVEILNHPALQATFQAHGLWDVLLKIIGDPSPDFARLLHRGQDGQRIIEWLALALPLAGRVSARMPDISPQSPIAIWGAGWLDANNMLPVTSSASAGVLR